mgnify:CR=1 FL=1|jgi:hypothetical protein
MQMSTGDEFCTPFGGTPASYLSPANVHGSGPRFRISYIFFLLKVE